MFWFLCERLALYENCTTLLVLPGSPSETPAEESGWHVGMPAPLYPRQGFEFHDSYECPRNECSGSSFKGILLPNTFVKQRRRLFLTGSQIREPVCLPFGAFSGVFGLGFQGLPWDVRESWPH